MSAQKPVDCSAISMSTYQAHEAGVGLLSSLVPFIGPALSSLIPAVPNLQSKLDQAKSDLTSATNNWQSTITEWVDAESDLVTDFVTLMIGNGGDGTGYIDTAIDYATQLEDQKTIMLQINFFFLAIIVAILSYKISLM
jgi:hypothetical protein